MKNKTYDKVERTIHILIMVLKALFFWFTILCMALIICGIDSIMEWGYLPFAIAVMYLLGLILFMKMFFTKKEAYIFSGAFFIDKLIDKVIWKGINEEEEKDDE